MATCRFGITDDFKRYHDDYVKLYVTTIKPIVNMEDPTRTYLSSSPSDGKETEKEGWVAKDPGSEYYGDGEVLTMSLYQSILNLVDYAEIKLLCRSFIFGM